MILVEGSKINVLNNKKEDCEVNIEQLKVPDNIISVMTMYSKVTFEPCKKIETIFNYIPYISMFEKTLSENVIKLTFKNNYNEIEKSVSLTSDHKVYTLNKGYVSVDNLGMMDVLVDSLGHICMIVSKEIMFITNGLFFNINLKYGNNIIVNDLVITPK